MVSNLDVRQWPIYSLIQYLSDNNNSFEKIRHSKGIRVLKGVIVTLLITLFIFRRISTITTNTPCVGGGQNPETYWVGGRNIPPITRANSIQARRHNDFRSASIIAKNCIEGLLGERNISWDKSRSNITLMSWIA